MLFWGESTDPNPHSPFSGIPQFPIPIIEFFVFCVLQIA